MIAVKGSGSNAVRINGITVPEHRTVSLASPPFRAHAMHRFGEQSPLFAPSLGLAAIVSGIGRFAFDSAIQQASTRTSIVNRAAWADWPAVQNSVATADATIEATRLAVFAVADECWSDLHNETRSCVISPTNHARINSVTDHAVRTMRSTVSDLFTVGSVDALRSGHGLEQSLRDVHGFSVQWERYRRLHYAAGRVLLGASAGDPLF